MSVRESTKTYQVLRVGKDGRESAPLDFIGEEPLSIRIEDKPYSVLMRTPGDEVFEAAGFCLGEGIVDSRDDFKTIGYDEQQDPNLVDVWLQPERKEKIGELLERRGFVSQASCGICGKEMIQDIRAHVEPAGKGPEIEVDQAFECLARLDRQQVYYKATRGSHAALVLDARAEPVSFAEDVGRHNALDKAIGKALMDHRLPGADIVVLSSRNSYELVQKASRARLSIMISNSRPTALAIEMGRALGLTLVFRRKDELVVVCGEGRIRIA